jgi:hypothetical protein
MWLHGGGWVACSRDTHDGPCRALANRTGWSVVSVDYRLAPEHRFPAALEDAWRATQWTARQAGRLVVGGDSFIRICPRLWRTGVSRRQASGRANSSSAGPSLATLRSLGLPDFPFHTFKFPAGTFDNKGSMLAMGAALESIFNRRLSRSREAGRHPR